MIKEKIETVVCGLNVLAGVVSEDAWNVIKLAGQSLLDVAEQAEELENRLVPPPPDDSNESGADARAQ
jgi:hypothetical protein